ncbi:MAG TPA: pantoate--beta-alanine ligase [Xanthomonadaceae bacterium]|nr:pantoate--beta-alanine ligase [Xanthomonadaceae bacterium]
MMRIVAGIDPLRAQVLSWRQAGESVAFVPTMGNLHAGHYSLARMAAREADRVVASIFVNPTQFGPAEDLAHYPRTPGQDAEGLHAHGCDLLFAPAVETVYPFGPDGCVRVHVPGLSDILCGEHRPGHFDGVATVVLRLLNMVQPDVAVFGNKDRQQLAVIAYLVRDLALPVRLVAGATVREADGLAMSSRNRYLDAHLRRTAARLYQVLQEMRAGVAAAAPLAGLEAQACSTLADAGFDVDYARILRQDLAPAQPGQRSGLVGLVAARLGGTRLIDNLDLDPDPQA